MRLWGYLVFSIVRDNTIRQPTEENWFTSIRWFTHQTAQALLASEELNFIFLIEQFLFIRFEDSINYVNLRICLGFTFAMVITTRLVALTEMMRFASIQSQFARLKSKFQCAQVYFIFRCFHESSDGRFTHAFWANFLHYSWWEDVELLVDKNGVPNN
jgi:hypothetical protein